MRRKGKWTDSIGDAVSGAKRHLSRPGDRSSDEDGTMQTRNDDFYDPSYSSHRGGSRKKRSRSPYYNSDMNEDHIRDVEHQREIDDLKYGVAKNYRSIEKKVDKVLDINDEELIRLNNRVDYLASKVNKAGHQDVEALRDYMEHKFKDSEKKSLKAFEELEKQNAHLQKKIFTLEKVVNGVMNEKGGAPTKELTDEINTLYTKKREQAAKLDQALARIANLEKDLFDRQDSLGKNKISDRELVALRGEMNSKIKDIQLRQEKDLNLTDKRLHKRIDDIQGAIEQLDQGIDAIEQRRLNGENNLLKKSVQLLKEGSMDDVLYDMKRRIKDIETHIHKPVAPERINIEKEEIIKELVQGMAQFERDITDMKKQLGEHDQDIQDEAKLLNVLDQEKIKDKAKLENLRVQILELDRNYEALKRDKAQTNQDIDDLRLACESEFNHVKKAEITDFKNLNSKINELTNLQDIVEHLSNQVEYQQREIDGVRKENSHGPVKIKNRVGTDALSSSMSPATMLFSDLKNKRHPESDETLAKYTDTPLTTKFREKLLSRSRIENPNLRDNNNSDSDDHKPRETDFLKTILNKTQDSDRESDPRRSTFLADPFKMKHNKADHRPSRDKSHDRTQKRRRDSLSSKYSYDQKKQVSKQNEKLNKGDKSGLNPSTNKGMQPNKPNKGKPKTSKSLKKSRSKSKISHKSEESYSEEGSEGSDLPRGPINPPSSVGDKVSNLNKMNNTVKKKNK
ncbi:unnamed protein product [Moneuplotes crassus]|uniref:Uncharacterized protein n=1 Tax=Euplotes crassus TaxID=5936 RepID=A0AAD1YCZ6_EUPCR|nr:unnamed protein product [Moneuplotes crassus]